MIAREAAGKGFQLHCSDLHRKFACPIVDCDGVLIENKRRILLLVFGGDEYPQYRNQKADRDTGEKGGHEQFKVP